MERCRHVRINERRFQESIREDQPIDVASPAIEYILEEKHAETMDIIRTPGMR